MIEIKMKVSDRMVRNACSPLYWLVSALTGVSVSFAPLFLYMAGKKGVDILDIEVLSLFAIIYFVPFYYQVFGAKLVHEIRRSKMGTGAV